MTPIKTLSLLIALLCLSPTLFSQNTGYTYQEGDDSGIGKWYMGREIAHVMGYQGMAWLERNEREEEERTSLLLQNMNIQDKDVVADIGAGSGYHVFPLAKMASRGTIYAVDLQDEMLSVLKAKKAKGNLKNVHIVKGGEKNVQLKANTLNKVLIVDVYHEMAHPIEIMGSIYQALKPDGLLYLIEYRSEDPNVPIKKLHKMTEQQAVKEMESFGFRLQENIDNLPWQHCLVFTKNNP